MISAKHHQIFHPDRGFLYVRIWSEGFGAGEPVPPTQTAYEWVEPVSDGDWWKLDHIERFLADPNCPIDKDGVRIVPFATCACCGREASRWQHLDINLVKPDPDPQLRQYRCWTHRESNPCAIDGCNRTRAAKGHFGDDQHLCSDHWRRFVPPRSPARRAYHRFFRQAKQHGWAFKRGRSTTLRHRFHHFWDALIARARRQSVEGRLDMTEINQLFGWGE